MAVSGETRELTHTRAVQDIARVRFAFPTERHKHYKTYINHPEQTMGIRLPSGGAVYPDIVVVEDPENYVRILAEVETVDTVNAESAKEWLTFAQLGPLYLFVPVGTADRAKQLCKQFKVPIVGLRTWRYVLGYDEIEINDISTQPAGPEELLPGPLRGLAKKFL